MMTEVNKDYRFSHRGKGFGAKYQKTLQFEWQKILLQFERDYLSDMFFSLLGAGSRVACLDFACGTGRVLSFLRDHFDDVTGVDISSDMLEVCREHNPDASIICADLTVSPEVLAGKKYDVITAFRFFPNAQPQLREDSLKTLVSHLGKNGIFVTNNHRNSSSFLFLIRRLFFRPDSEGMSRKEMCGLLERNGMYVVAKKGFGVFPSWNQWVFLPCNGHRLIDWLVEKLRLSEYLAQDVVYICRKRM